MHLHHRPTIVLSKASYKNDYNPSEHGLQGSAWSYSLLNTMIMDSAKRVAPLLEGNAPDFTASGEIHLGEPLAQETDDNGDTDLSRSVATDAEWSSEWAIFTPSTSFFDNGEEAWEFVREGDENDDNDSSNSRHDSKFSDRDGESFGNGSASIISSREASSTMVVASSSIWPDNWSLPPWRLSRLSLGQSRRHSLQGVTRRKQYGCI